jgi:hypothetical protein
MTKQQHIDALLLKLERQGDKAAAIFNELYRVTDAMYATASELRRASAALIAARHPRKKKAPHARRKHAR